MIIWLSIKAFEALYNTKVQGVELMTLTGLGYFELLIELVAAFALLVCLPIVLLTGGDKK